MNEDEIKAATAVPTFRLGIYWFYQDKLIVDLDSIAVISVMQDHVKIYRTDDSDPVWLNKEFAEPLIAAFKEYQIWKLVNEGK